MPNLWGDNREQKLYGRPQWKVQGVAACCSAAALTNISRGVPKHTPNHYLRNPNRHYAEPVQKVHSIWNYWQLYNKNPMYALPYEYQFLTILEDVFLKSTHGESVRQVAQHESYRLFADDYYCTRTWFITDMRRARPVGENDPLHCEEFMLWFQSKPELGTIQISPFKDGAHGGYCRGAVFTLNEEFVKEMLEGEYTWLNQHIKYLHERFGEKEVPRLEDEVCQHW